MPVGNQIKLHFRSVCYRICNPTISFLYSSETMDFIPRVQNPVHPQLEVPWFVRDGEEYVPGDFEAWPPKRGFNPKALKDGDFGGKSWSEVVSFVQSWAYFGMLVEVLRVGGIKYTILQSNADEYIAARPGKTTEIPSIGDKSRQRKPGTLDLGYLSSTLPDLILMWYHANVDLDEPHKKERSSRIAKILFTVFSFVSSVFAQEYFGGEKVSSSAEILQDEKPETRANIEQQQASEHSHSFGRIITDQYYKRSFTTSR